MLERPEILLAALDHIGEIVIVTQPDGCITYANSGFERITGYTAEEVIGKKPNVLASGQTPRSVYRSLWDTILTGRVWEGLLVNRRKDGTLFDCRLVVAPVYEDGEIVRLVSIQQDLTTHMDARRALERHAGHLEEAVAARTRELEAHVRALVQAEKLSTLGEVSASIAHEILNPLMGISGAIQILQRRMAQADPARPVLDRIRSEVQRLDETVRGLLSMIRPIQQAPRERVDFADVLRGALALVRSETRDAGVQVITEAPADPVFVRANANQIRQILLNLAINAIHELKGRPDPVLRVAWSADERDLEVRVMDNGPGFPPELLPRLFDALVTTKKGGTGLGLSISNRIARNHEGSLRAENLPDGGACFTLRLPVAAPAEGDGPVARDPRAQEAVAAKA
jgi:PAS domain S-box-containing protein